MRCIGPGRRSVAPLLLGLMGVAFGTVAVVDGARWWGAAGVFASGGAMIVSFYLEAGLSVLLVNSNLH